MYSVAYIIKNLPVNGKRGPVPEEMSKTLLTKKKLGKKEKVHANIVFALFGKNVFISIENLRSP